MPEFWPVNFNPADKEQATELAQRLTRLGLTPHTYVATFRTGLAIALAASDEDLREAHARATTKE